MNGKKLNQILNIGAKHALYRKDGSWYHHLTDFPGVLFDCNGYLIFECVSNYLNHTKLQHAQDLHIKEGISSIDGYKTFSFEERKMIFMSSKECEDEEILRKIRQLEIIIRNFSLVKYLKGIYKNTCQICKIKLQIGENLYYSEIHHIRPLGNPHNGPDKLENMICVCPNCHVLLDFGVIRLNRSFLKVLKHRIEDEYISYYNNLVDLKMISINKVFIQI